ncbi:MAG: ABC transporter substrate-binding protein [Oscillospiraceae bacterium]|nr:ABC transporter substrate-binding protein [Oscillospiraceae bacterium]
MKILAVIFAAVIVLSALSGCEKNSEPIQNSNGIISETDKKIGGEVTFTDSAGRTVTVSDPQKTAVFTSSFADIWQLAGGTVSFATEDAFDSDSLTLPDNVVNIGLLDSPSAELLIDGEADFVILSSTAHGGTELAETLEQAGITCALFEVEDFEDYLNVLKICTDITGRQDLHEKNGKAVQKKINDIISEQQNKEQKNVLYLRAFSTGIKAKGSDSMTGKMLADMNCVNIADTVPSLLEELSIEEIIEQDPDFIFITIMGSDEEKAQKSYEDILASNPAWSGLSAVKNERCIFLPKQYFHNKPNAEWDKAYEMLAEILNDEKPD